MFIQTYLTERDFDMAKNMIFVTRNDVEFSLFQRFVDM